MHSVRAEVDLTPAMGPVAVEYAKVATAIQIIDVYLAHSSPFLPGAPDFTEPQPVLKLRTSLSARLQALASELGLTPMAKHRLKKDPEAGPGASLLKVFAEAEEIANRERERATVDGDFEPEGDTNERGDEA